jgi:hypothetical protein
MAATKSTRVAAMPSIKLLAMANAPTARNNSFQQNIDIPILKKIGMF